MLTMSKDTYGATGVNYTLLDGSDFRPVTPGIIPKNTFPTAVRRSGGCFLRLECAWARD